MITQAYLQRLLDYDPSTGIFRWKVTKWGHVKKGKRAGYQNPRGYRLIKLQGENYLEHRLAWLYLHGTWPDETIDHKNRNMGNNSIAELRAATYTQNQGNKIKGKNNTSGYKGVSWHKRRKKWKARIVVRGKAFELGFFSTPQDAHVAYVAAAKQHFGAYARFA